MRRPCAGRWRTVLGQAANSCCKRPDHEGRHSFRMGRWKEPQSATFRLHGEAGQLLAQPFALTFGASGFLFAHYNGFKLVVALLADVFKNRHFRARLK
jgi:hypothetical protein